MINDESSDGSVAVEFTADPRSQLLLSIHTLAAFGGAYQQTVGDYGEDLAESWLRTMYEITRERMKEYSKVPLQLLPIDATGLPETADAIARAIRQPAGSRYRCFVQGHQRECLLLVDEFVDTLMHTMTVGLFWLTELGGRGPGRPLQELVEPSGDRR
jgi:hypothetical protein